MPVVSTPPLASPVVDIPTVEPAEDDNHFTSQDAAKETSPHAAALQFDRQAAGTATRLRGRGKRGKRRGWAAIVIGVLASLVLLCGAGAGGLGWLLGLISLPGVGPVRTGESWEWPQGNCTFRAPDNSWKQDKEMQVKLKANLVLKRARPDDYLALAFVDYKTRAPSEAELREGAMDRLKAYFRQGTLETEPKPDATLAGQPALALEFAGSDDKHVLMTGVCYLFTYRGYGFWFFTWGPQSEADAIQPEWEVVRAGFGLLDERPGWMESPPVTEIARSTAGSKIRLQLKPVKGLWKMESLENPETRSLYDKAELVLSGTYPGSAIKAATSATCQVVVLDDMKPSDLAGAVQAAKDFLLEREKDKREGGDYTYPETKIDFVQDKTLRNINDPIGKGLTEGQVQKLLVANDKERHRYVVLRIVNHPQGVVMVWLECDNRLRDYWDPEFMALLETLEFVK
jgi:hypothetical protein